MDQQTKSQKAEVTTRDVLWIHLKWSEEYANELGLDELAGEISHLMAHHKIEKPASIAKPERETRAKVRETMCGAAYVP